jgi:polar amino acid transport system substrate-binding protein
MNPRFFNWRITWNLMIFSFCCANFANAQAQEKTLFEVASHYDYAPYVIDKDRGLTEELAHYLSKKSNGRYLFQVSILPKPRLLKKVNHSQWVGIIPWVIPIWMKELPLEKFLWSEPILGVGDQLLSRKSAPIEWRGSISLHNKTFGAIRGHSYADLEQDFQLGKIKREDAPSFQSNLNKLQIGRVDAIFLSNITVDFFAKSSPHHLDTLHVSNTWRYPQKHEVRLLFKLNNKLASDWLLQRTKAMQTDPEWLDVLQSYGLRAR